MEKSVLIASTKFIGAHQHPNKRLVIAVDEAIKKSDQKDVENGIIQREYKRAEGAFLGDEVQVEFEVEGGEEEVEDAVEKIRDAAQKANKRPEYSDSSGDAV